MYDLGAAAGTTLFRFLVVAPELCIIVDANYTLREVKLTVTSTG